jgi:predicted nuclease of predicted toxin-antitoxin system
LRLLLDANLSPRGMAMPLRESGHDVLALAEDAAFEGLPDPHVLELAVAEQRVLVTRNSRDFAPLAREWAEAQRPHAGVILIWTLDHSRFSEIIAGIERHLERWPGFASTRAIRVRPMDSAALSGVARLRDGQTGHCMSG